MSNVICIFTRRYLEVPDIPVDHVPPKRKPRKPKNQPADLAQEWLEHNESVKRQYRLT